MGVRCLLLGHDWNGDDCRCCSAVRGGLARLHVKSDGRWDVRTGSSAGTGVRDVSKPSKGPGASLDLLPCADELRDWLAGAMDKLVALAVGRAPQGSIVLTDTRDLWRARASALSDASARRRADGRAGLFGAGLCGRCQAQVALGIMRDSGRPLGSLMSDLDALVGLPRIERIGTEIYRAFVAPDIPTDDSARSQWSAHFLTVVMGQLEVEVGASALADDANRPNAAQRREAEGPGGKISGTSSRGPGRLVPRAG